jgi:hypothetical protein
MIGLLPSKRFPALIVGFLAVFLLLSRGQPVSGGPAEALLAGVPLALCHTGSDDERHGDHPASDCDACLLCVAMHGDQAGTPLLPASAVVPPVSAAALVRPVPEILWGAGIAAPRGARARAPPTDG